MSPFACLIVLTDLFEPEIRSYLFILHFLHLFLRFLDKMSTLLNNSFLLIEILLGWGKFPLNGTYLLIIPI